MMPREAGRGIPGEVNDQTPLLDPFMGTDSTAAAHRDHDWAASALGAIDGWSPTLRSLVRNVLPSRMPVMLWWGPELRQLYNDAFADLIGEKHPGAVGARAEGCWVEVWNDLGPLAERALSGEAVYAHELPLLVHRHGFDEETFWTFSFSPIRGVSGEIDGLLVAAIDATEAVVRGRRLAVLRDIGAISTADGRSVDRLLGHIVTVLERHPGKVAFAVARLERGRDEPLKVVRTFGTEAPSDAALPGDPRLLTEVRDSCEAREEEVPAGGWAVPVTSAGARVTHAIHLPIVDRSEDRVVAVLTVGINPHRAFDDDYRSFLDLMARQVSTAASDARAMGREQERSSELVELDRIKNRFLQNVSHELRTPLTLIAGSHRSLAERADLPEAAERDLAVAERGTLRLARLVEGLLDLARSDEGVLEPAVVPTDLAALTAEIASMVRSTITRAGLDLRVQIADLPDAVQVDPEMWAQIVSNLLSNAYKFTTAGSVSLELSVNAGVVHLKVADTGIGMTPAEVARAFERFHQVRGLSPRTAEGAGIGLALVHDLVAVHDGDVEIDSHLGRGTSVTVPMPVHRAEPDQLDLTGALRGARALAAEAASWGPSETTSGRPVPSDDDDRPTILVVEDNADLRTYLIDLLGPSLRVSHY